MKDNNSVDNADCIGQLLIIWITSESITEQIYFRLQDSQ